MIMVMVVRMVSIMLMVVRMVSIMLKVARMVSIMIKMAKWSQNIKGWEVYRETIYIIHLKNSLCDFASLSYLKLAITPSLRVDLQDGQHQYKEPRWSL